MKEIIWRGYLTILVLSSIGLLIVGTIEVLRYHNTEKNRDLLLTYIEAEKKNPFWDARTDRECLEKLVRYGGFIANCDLKEVPTDLANLGVHAYTDFYSEEFLLTKSILGALVLLIIIRYWIAWMYSGQRPGSFP